MLEYWRASHPRPSTKNRIERRVASVGPMIVQGLTVPPGYLIVGVFYKGHDCSDSFLLSKRFRLTYLGRAGGLKVYHFKAAWLLKALESDFGRLGIYTDLFKHVSGLGRGYANRSLAA